jgi:ankyrin repeat protein
VLSHSGELRPSDSEVPAGTSEHSGLVAEAMRLCGRQGGALRFPGGQPHSMLRSELPVLGSGRYMAALKSDGVRHMLLLTRQAGEPVAVMLDRALRMFEVEVWANDCFFDGSLFDGELIWQYTARRQPRLVFLVFDLLAACGASCLHEPYSARVARAHALVLPELPPDLPASGREQFVADENRVHLINNSHGLQVRPKRVLPAEHVADVWADRACTGHVNDGLIFTPDGHVECVRALLGATGIRVDQTAVDKEDRPPTYERTDDWTDEWTALVYAASSEACTRALIAAGADVNHQEELHGRTPLYHAAECGSAACVTALAEAGARHVRSTWGGPLAVACCKHGDLECVAALLAAGARVDDEDRYGTTALHGACTGECARALIAAGARVNCVNEWGWTPLFRAACMGRVGTVQALLDAGADPNASGERGSTPMMSVVEERDNDDIVLALLRAGADVHARNISGCTALWIACEQGRVRCVEVLIDAGADIEARGRFWGQYFTLTPLLVARQYHHTGCVHALIAAGADVHAAIGRHPAAVGR